VQECKARGTEIKNKKLLPTAITDLGNWQFSDNRKINHSLVPNPL